jgi:hypothetical protein
MPPLVRVVRVHLFDNIFPAVLKDFFARINPAIIRCKLARIISSTEGVTTRPFETIMNIFIIIMVIIGTLTLIIIIAAQGTPLEVTVACHSCVRAKARVTARLGDAGTLLLLDVCMTVHGLSECALVGCTRRVRRRAVAPVTVLVATALGLVARRGNGCVIRLDWRVCPPETAATQDTIS